MAETETYQVGYGVVHGDGAQRRTAMGHVRVAPDVVQLEARVELYGPLTRLKVVRRNRELGEGNAAACTPEDDPAAALRRAVDPGLQHAEAHLIPVPPHRGRCTRMFQGKCVGGRICRKCDVPE
jgi:hypothetical protein